MGVISYETNGAIALPHGQSQRHSLGGEEGSHTDRTSLPMAPDGSIITVGSTRAAVVKVDQRRKEVTETVDDPLIVILDEALNVNNLRKVVQLSRSTYRPLHYRYVL